MSAQMEINRAKLCRVRVGSNGDFMIMEHQQLLIVSGNILKGGGSRVLPNMPMDEEVILSLDDTLRRCLQFSQYKSEERFSPAVSPMLDPLECCSKGITVEHSGEVERFVAVDPKFLEPFCGLDELDFQDTNVTIKLFIAPGKLPHPDIIDDIINLLHRHLCVVRIHNFLLSLGDNEEQLGSSADNSTPSLTTGKDSNNELTALAETWKRLEVYVDRGLISRLGVCDFTAVQLEKFIKTVRIRPASNQIAYDFRNCCSGPQHDLLTYCKQNDIELLTHQDRQFIQGKLFRALMRKYRILSSLSKPTSPTAVEHGLTADPSSIQVPPAPEDDYPLPTFQTQISPSWFLRYTSSLKSRGVATNRGYILLAGAAV